MAPAPRYPDFYCIGSQKSATTWLYRCMETHPAVFTSPYKEVHYFDSLYVDFHRRIHDARIDKGRAHFEQLAKDRERAPLKLALRRLLRTPKERNAERRMRWWLDQEGREIDDAWYAGVFAGARPDQVAFDVTPAYAVLPPEGIAHMRRLSPNGKILLILRDPVERSFSHAKMSLKNSGQPMTEERLFAAATSPLVASRDRYLEIIDAYEAAFPGRFLLGFYEEVQRQPLLFLEKICRFIDVPFRPGYFPKAKKVVYRGPDVSLSPALRARLTEHHRELIEAVRARYPEWTADWGKPPAP